MKLLRLATIICLTLFVTAPAASADKSSRRQVGGHYFTPSILSSYPMVTTNAQTNLGLGYARFKLTDQNTGQKTSYKFAAVAFQLGADVAFTDWIGIRLGTAGTVLSGINTISALAIGAMTNVGVGAGPVIRVVKAGPFQLTTGLNAIYGYSNVISPPNLVAGNGLQKSNSLDLEPYLAFAIGIGRFVGVQGSFEYEFERDLTNDATAHSIGVAAVLSLDFTIIGINAGYRFGRDITGEENSHKIETALYYTGRKNLSLGFSLNFTIPKSDQLIFVLNYAMIYYW